VGNGWASECSPTTRRAVPASLAADGNRPASAPRPSRSRQRYVHQDHAGHRPPGGTGTRRACHQLKTAQHEVSCSTAHPAASLAHDHTKQRAITRSREQSTTPPQENIEVAVLDHLTGTQQHSHRHPISRIGTEYWPSAPRGIELSGWAHRLPPPSGASVGSRLSQHCSCLKGLVPDKLHKDPHVRRAIEQLIAKGWRIQEQGHKYNLLRPCGRDGCGWTARLRTPRTTHGGSCAKPSGVQTVMILTVGRVRSDSTCLFRTRNSSASLGPDRVGRWGAWHRTSGSS
jgi:hypothetical protein